VKGYGTVDSLDGDTVVCIILTSLLM
jgi:hypothetical protein